MKGKRVVTLRHCALILVVTLVCVSVRLLYQYERSAPGGWRGVNHILIIPQLQQTDSYLRERERYVRVSANVTTQANKGNCTQVRYNHTLRPQIFTVWLTSAQSLCTNDSVFTAYANDFAVLYRATLDPIQFKGQKGGQQLQSVMQQSEQLEYYKYNKGCFQLSSCESVRYSYQFGKPVNHLNSYLHSVTTGRSATTHLKPTRLTVAVTRYEYVNLYHTMTDWYNGYLMMRFFNRTAEETDVLLVDAHPLGSLDTTWQVLFSSSTRVSDVRERTVYPVLVWSILGYSSPLYVNSGVESIPLVEEFRHFFLTRHCISPTHRPSCTALNILFIWRHDYVAHPRNPSGVVRRKIHNEQQILLHFKKKYPDFNIEGIQLDSLDMREQLRYTAKADILVGMHGAGLTHALFLPQHASLIELYPAYQSTSNTHFQQIAKWRGLFYQNWNNVEERNEIRDTYSTIVQPSVIEDMVNKAISVMGC